MTEKKPDLDDLQKTLEDLGIVPGKRPAVAPTLDLLKRREAKAPQQPVPVRRLSNNSDGK